MHAIRTLVTGIAATAALAAPSTAFAGSAPPSDTATHLSASWKDCPSGAVCLYTKDNGQGTQHKIYGESDHDYKHINSVWNHGKCGPSVPCWAVLKKGKNSFTCVPPGKKMNFPDHTIYSVRWSDSC
jgi:hypothetical protein